MANFEPLVEQALLLVVLDRLERCRLDQRDGEIADRVRQVMDVSFRELNELECLWLEEFSHRLTEAS